MTDAPVMTVVTATITQSYRKKNPNNTTSLSASSQLMTSPHINHALLNMPHKQLHEGQTANGDLIHMDHRGAITHRQSMQPRRPRFYNLFYRAVRGMACAQDPRCDCTRLYCNIVSLQVFTKMFISVP